MKEADSFRDLRPYLARLFAIDRVENAVMPGMPDVLLSAESMTLYIEMKAEIGKRLRGSQVAWCQKRMATLCFADMFVIAKKENDYVLFLMIDVVANAGLVTLNVEHMVFKDPEYLTYVLHGYIGHIQGGLHEVRRRVGAVQQESRDSAGPVG